MGMLWLHHAWAPMGGLRGGSGISSANTNMHTHVHTHMHTHTHTHKQYFFTLGTLQLSDPSPPPLSFPSSFPPSVSVCAALDQRHPKGSVGRDPSTDLAALKRTWPRRRCR
jgi:hypothetical protein